MAWVLLAVGVLVYFLPAIVAMQRGHRNGPAILTLNLLLGWTFVGWVAAIVWAMTENVAPRGSSIEPPNPWRNPELWRD